MNVLKTIVISTLVSTVTLVSSAAISGDAKTGNDANNASPNSQHMMYSKPCYKPMMEGEKGQMPYMQMMQQRHAAADEHMKRMEAHMDKVEALLKQLVELQKK